MKKYGIQKRERIHLQREILNVFENGNQCSDKYLKIYALQNGRSYTRFMPVINKKFGKSTVRNKAKRHVRELFRSNKEELKTGYDIIFFIKNEFKNIPFQDKNENYLRLLEKAGVTRE